MPETTSFSSLLRRYRRDAGLSQEGLAERAGISRRTISDLERGTKSTPQPATLRLIVEALDLAEDDRRELAASVPRRKHRSATPEPAAPTGALPSDLTPLLGREHDEMTVLQLLQSRGLRLLTLVGPGGVGKTRLAVRVAETASGEYADGVCLVSLAAATSPSQVPSLIARTLGLKDRTPGPELERLTNFLQERELLLLLDNFEHVLEAAGPINDLLLACPRLTILATSRAPLRLRAEHLFDVSALALPDRQDLSVEAAIGYPSVALFVQRARAGGSNFRLTLDLVPIVIDICRRCDGLPLAIELAASHVRYLSAAGVLGRLRSGDYASLVHAVDAPLRQQTIFSTIAWSYDLLSPAERRLFETLSVFQGSASSEAVGDVSACDEGETRRLLESLVAKSLVTRHGPDGVRFGMLETVREFALRTAREAGSLEEGRRRHASHYVELTRAMTREVREHGPASGWALVQDDYENMLAALGWLESRDMTAEAVEMAGCLAELWIFWGQIEEGRRRLDGLIARAERGPAAVPALAYASAARLAWIQNDFARATALYESALEEYRRSGTPRDEASTLNNLGTVFHVQTEYEQAAAYYREAVERARACGAPLALAMPLGNLAVIAMQQGDFVGAATFMDEAIDLYRGAGDQQRVAIMLSNRGDLAFRQDRYEEAVTLHREALAIKQAIGDGLSVATSQGDLGLALIELDRLDEAEDLLAEAVNIFVNAGQRNGLAEAAQAAGRIAQKRGQYGRAARLYGGAEALRSHLGIKVHPADEKRYQTSLAELTAALPPESLEPAWEAGSRLSMEDLARDAVPTPSRLRSPSAT